MTHIDKYTLTDGSVYTGECEELNDSIIITGKGELISPNGKKYVGSLKNGKPDGYGTMYFPNKFFHCGIWKNGIPNGIGYENRGSDMQAGFYLNGQLNGMAIVYENNVFKFGNFRDSLLVKDYSKQILWLRAHITMEMRYRNFSNVLKIKESTFFGDYFVRFGVPATAEREGFCIMFFENGETVAGVVFKDDYGEGDYFLYNSLGDVVMGLWVNGELIKPRVISDYQQSEDNYLDNGFLVYSFS